MRKLILQEWITLNGYAAEKEGTTDFFNKPELNEQSDDDQLAFMKTVDTILLGANTYRMFVQFWPTDAASKEVIADTLNATPKIVFSKSLEQAPWGKWDAATVESGDAIAAVEKLKQQPGKNIVLWGSLSLAQTLMEAGLIDEYELRICPTILNGGTPLFAEGQLHEMQLLEARAYPSGLLFTRYKKL